MGMGPEYKKKLYTKIEEKIPGILSTPTEVKEFDTLRAKGFPHHLFLEWKEHCKIYNDIHWAKIWSDHLKAQAYDKEQALIRSSVERAEPEEEQQENEESLIGDPYEGIENEGDEHE